MASRFPRSRLADSAANGMAVSGKKKKKRRGGRELSGRAQGGAAEQRSSLAIPAVSLWLTRPLGAIDLGRGSVLVSRVACVGAEGRRGHGGVPPWTASVGCGGVWSLQSLRSAPFRAPLDPSRSPLKPPQSPSLPLSSTETPQCPLCFSAWLIPNAASVLQPLRRREWRKPHFFRKGKAKEADSIRAQELPEERGCHGEAKQGVCLQLQPPQKALPGTQPAPSGTVPPLVKINSKIQSLVLNLGVGRCWSITKPIASQHILHISSGAQVDGSASWISTCSGRASASLGRALRALPGINTLKSDVLVVISQPLLHLSARKNKGSNL